MAATIIWNPTTETAQRLIAIARGEDNGLRSHHARILADRELNKRGVAWSAVA